MIVDLNNLPALKCIQIVDYCWENSIEPDKCLDFVLGLRTDKEDLEFDIPEEHITLMILSGIICE